MYEKGTPFAKVYYYTFLNGVLFTLYENHQYRGLQYQVKIMFSSEQARHE